MRRVTHVSIVSWLLAVFVASSLPARHLGRTACIRSSASHPLPFLTPSLPVFEFDLSTLQSRYVMITALYTRESPFYVNRNHLRANTPARYPGTTCLPVRNPETKERTFAPSRPNLRHSPVPGRLDCSREAFSANLKKYFVRFYIPVSSFMIVRQRAALIIFNRCYKCCNGNRKNLHNIL